MKSKRLVIFYFNFQRQWKWQWFCSSAQFCFILFRFVLFRFSSLIDKINYIYCIDIMNSFMTSLYYTEMFHANGTRTHTNKIIDAVLMIPFYIQEY